MQVFKTISKQHSIDIQDVKTNLQILSGDTSNDTLIQSLIDAAIDYCESRVGNIALNTKELTISNYRFGSEIQIDDTNLSAVTSLSIDGVAVIDYKLYIGSSYSVIKLNNPITADTILINYVAGFTNIQPRYKQAIIIKASDLFDTERTNYSYNVTANNCIDRLLGFEK